VEPDVKEGEGRWASILQWNEARKNGLAVKYWARDNSDNNAAALE